MATKCAQRFPVREPWQWLENCKSKVGHGVKPKATKKSLWIHGCFNPFWVIEELHRRGSPTDSEKTTHRIPLLGNDEVSAFVSLLRTCAKKKDLRGGTTLHDHILKRGLLKQCSDALVTMYAKCGELVKAQELLDMHKSRDVFSWTDLIDGYAQKGQGQDALNCFACMQQEGLSPDAVTYACILKACASIKAVDRGEEFHHEIARQGLLQHSSVLGNTLVDMYAKCGALEKARCVLQELPKRDVISWSALIAGYAQHGHGEQALNCFEKMQHEGLSPNAVTFLCILKACGAMKAADKGEKIHDEIARQGLLQNNVALGNALVDMYAKCGALGKAEQVLGKLPSQNVVSWNALISGYVQQGQGEEALICFERMQRKSISPDAVTYLCILKACGSIGASEKGEQIHDEIAKQGLVQKDIVIGTAVVDMYVKCSALARAHQVLEELPVRDVVSWSALIAGYAQQGQGEQALHCFEQMQREGISPNEVTFLYALKACGSIGATGKGEQIHEKIARQGFLENDIVLGTAIVDMYAKCGALVKSQQVLEELPVKNLFTWNALIAGYAQQGQIEQALHCLERMQLKGLSPNSATFLCILKACGSIGSVYRGEQIHDRIARQGLLRNDIVLSNAVVDMYVKCGALGKARHVFEELPIRDVISWSALIAGYAQQDQGEAAIDCFERMQCEGLSPNSVTLLCMLKACGSIGAVDKGEELHDEIVKRGLLRDDLVLGSALVDMYAKCSAFEKAQQVLEELPVQNVVSWNALMTRYVDQGKAAHALNCFEQMQHKGLSPDAVTFLCVLKSCGSIRMAEKGEQVYEKIAREGLLRNDVMLGNAVVDMYAKCGAPAKAAQVLGELPTRDVVSWNAVIAGYAQWGQGEKALDCFKRMQGDGLSPNGVTFICVLQACGHIGAVDKGEQIHIEIARHGLLGDDIVLGTALVDMYAKCGALQKAQRVLEELPHRDIVSWNALIAGYAQQGQGEQALNCCKQMQHEGLSPNAVTFSSILTACGNTGAAEAGERIHDEIAIQGLLRNDVVLGTSLVDMYAKCYDFDKALEVFWELPLQNVVSWNALIAGYAQQGQGEKALKCFEQMKREGLSPDAVTFICILKACGTIGAADKGEQIHDEIARQGLLGSNIVLGNALVDMYAKCGALSKAEQVFEQLPDQNVVSWNALIAGYAQQGQAEQALNCFERMQRIGLSPDVLTYLCILKSCGTLGAADKGEKIHDEIARQRLLGDDTMLGIGLVDMYAKCGALAKAQRVLEELPVSNAVSWNALITGYAQQGQAEQALDRFERMQRKGVSPDAVTFLCILKACGSMGRVHDAQMYFQSMSTKYRVKPELEHYNCIVDIFGRTGHLDKAVEVIQNMPSCYYSIALWLALLGACGRWVDVNIGRWAFENAVQLDRNDAAAYVLMAKIYAAAGMQEDAENIEAMRIENQARKKKPAQHWWIDVNGSLHLFLVEDVERAQSKLIYTNCEMSGPLACGFISAPQTESLHIVQSVGIFCDSHVVMSCTSNIPKQKRVDEDTNQCHDFEDQKCSCGG